MVLISGQMKSFLDDLERNSTLDWSKPLFFRSSNNGSTSFQKVVASANKTLSKAQKLIDRIESAEQTSRINAELVPSNATIRKEYVRCGKRGCENEPHGPYYYAYWKEEMMTNAAKSACRKKLKKKYIGTRHPNDVIRP
jgi:hypothetical protein